MMRSEISFLCDFNYAAHMIDEHVTPVLHLHYLSVEMRLHFKDLIYTYKILNEHAPSYVCAMIEIYKPTKLLKFGGQVMFVVSKIRIKGYVSLKFSNAVATLWNDWKKIETVSFPNGISTGSNFSLSVFYLLCILCHNIAHVSIKSIQYLCMFAF